MNWEEINRAIDEFEKSQPTMKLNTVKGSKVIFKYPENGEQVDMERAIGRLVLDGEYTVETISIGGLTSFVELKEVPGLVFNTVQFMNKEAI